MSQVLDDLVDLLTLEPIEENLFRGRSQDLGFRQLFGGQVIGQSLSAASQTVEEARHVHSMHGYFLRPGDAELPVVYQVDRVRDGGSFSTRRVTAIQKGNPIFTCSASFQYDEEGFEHQSRDADRGRPGKPAIGAGTHPATRAPDPRAHARKTAVPETDRIPTGHRERSRTTRNRPIRSSTSGFAPTAPWPIPRRCTNICWPTPRTSVC